MNTVSVIIPAYNCAPYIQEAVESVLNQTYQNFELLIVDDGSADDTRRILKEFEKKYPDRVRNFYQSNQGASAARNKALKESRGEYIAFLDADDVWYPQKLAKQIQVLENTESGFVYCDNYFVTETREKIENYVRKVKFIEGDGILELFCNHFVMTPAVVFRKKYLLEIGYFDETLRVGEDYDFFLRLASVCTMTAVKEKLWERRVLKDSLSRKDFVMDARNDLMILKKFLSDHPDFYHAHKSRVRSRLSQYYFSFGYKYLEAGANHKGFLQFVKSLYYKISLRSLKNIFLCLVPFSVRRIYKKTHA